MPRYQTIMPGLNTIAHSCLLLNWMRVLTRFGEEVGNNFLVAPAAHINCSMFFRCRLVPVNLTRSHVELLDGSAISKFYSEAIAAEDHSHPVAGISMPGR